MIYFCYIDESGTPETSGNTSHYILAGFLIPINQWKKLDKSIYAIKKKYSLDNQEIHTAWITRRYLENNKDELFDKIKARFDRKNDRIVGVRHFTDLSCQCEICKNKV